MKRLLAALLGLILLTAPLQAQQTVPNAVNGSIYNTTPPALTAPQTAPFQGDSDGNLKTTVTAGGLSTARTSLATNTLILKATPGNLFRVTATMTTSSSGGMLQIFNTSTVPVDGAQEPFECIPIIPTQGPSIINYSPGPPEAYSIGIVAVISSATSCYSKLTGAISGFLSGMVQ